jgi:protein ImuA
MPAPPTPAAQACLDDLRGRIRLLERATTRPSEILPFGVAAIDAHLPEGGLARGTLHEIAGGGADEVHAAAAAAFAAGLLARMAGTALWVTTAADLFPPGLSNAGLPPDRLLHARAPDEKTVLLVMEEALRHSGLCGVVGEMAKLSMVASRRLVLAAEKSGVTALVVRRRAEGKPADATLTAAATRWRITPLPSTALPAPGIGRARWQVEMTRCRGGEPAHWIMEACDAQGRLSLPADLAHRPAAQAGRHAA